MGVEVWQSDRFVAVSKNKRRRKSENKKTKSNKSNKQKTKQNEKVSASVGFVC